VQDEEAMYIFS